MQLAARGDFGPVNRLVSMCSGNPVGGQQAMHRKKKMSSGRFPRTGRDIRNPGERKFRSQLTVESGEIYRQRGRESTSDRYFHCRWYLGMTDVDATTQMIAVEAVRKALQRLFTRHTAKMLNQQRQPTRCLAAACWVLTAMAVAQSVSQLQCT